MMYNVNKKVKDIPNIKAKYNYIAGVSIFTLAQNIFDINGFDERYFLYADDMDFCFEAQKRGIKLLWCKNAIVYHKGGASIGSAKDLDKRTYISEYYSNLSMFQFNKKWHPVLYKLFNFNRYFLKYLQFKIKKKSELMRALKEAKKYFKENY